MAEPRYHAFFRLPDGTRVIVNAKGPGAGPKIWKQLRQEARELAAYVARGEVTEPEVELFERGGR